MKTTWLRRSLALAMTILVPATARADYHLKGLGSGFFVAGQDVLTNAHVIAGCTGITVAHQDQDWFTASLVASDPGTDIALLATSEAGPVSAAFESAVDTIDPEDLIIVGFPKLGLPTIRPIVTPAGSMTAEIETPADRYKLHGDVRPGDSGSPVIDNHGMVVGMTEAEVDTVKIYKLTGKLIRDEGLAVSGAAMRRFLDSHQVAYMMRAGHDLPTADARFAAARAFVVQIGCWGD